MYSTGHVSNYLAVDYLWAHSSIGESRRLIIVWFSVQVRVGPPLYMKYKTNLVGTSKNMQIYSELEHAAKKRKKLTGWIRSSSRKGYRVYLMYEDVELGYIRNSRITDAIRFALQHKKNTFFKLISYLPWAHKNCVYWVEVYNDAIEILDNGRMICRFNDGTYVERTESEPIVFVDERKFVDHAILDAINKAIKYKV